MRDTWVIAGVWTAAASGALAVRDFGAAKIDVGRPLPHQPLSQGGRARCRATTQDRAGRQDRDGD